MPEGIPPKRGAIRTPGNTAPLLGTSTPPDMDDSGNRLLRANQQSHCNNGQADFGHQVPPVARLQWRWPCISSPASGAGGDGGSFPLARDDHQWDGSYAHGGLFTAGSPIVAAVVGSSSLIFCYLKSPLIAAESDGSSEDSAVNSGDFEVR